MSPSDIADGLPVSDPFRQDGEGLPVRTFTLLRAKGIVFATGALDRPMVFSNNDRPGVMLASAIRAHLNRFAVLAGRRIVIGTTGDSAYWVALDAVSRGAEVTLVDTREAVDPALAGRVRQSGIDLQLGTMLKNTKGRRLVVVALQLHLALSLAFSYPPKKTAGRLNGSFFPPPPT